MEAFEASLKEVVNAKRLSASKMSKLTETSLTLMERDTQLVSILYRTHKSLPAKQKASSLYVFDALCRAARHKVVKQGLTGDIHAETGNAATFLLKIEGVLDGLFEDMLSCGVPEAKEKAKKIIDIWTKSSTFPSDVLTRLSGLVKGEKETTQVPAITTADPRKQPTPPKAITPPVSTPTPTTPAPTPDAAQAALLALLSTAVAANSAPNSQIAINTSAVSTIPQTIATPTQPQIVVPQLALLQQLASKAGIVGPHLAGVEPTEPAFGLPRAPTANAASGIAGPSTSRSPTTPQQPYPIPDRRDPRPSVRDGELSVKGRGREDYHDIRRGGHHGGPRGGFQGHGREDYGGWKPAERNRYRDDDRGPPDQGRFSRSRSPPMKNRYPGQGKRDVKPYSPPHRPSFPSKANQTRFPAESERSTLSRVSESGKDEFGRDIRATSEEPVSDPALSDVEMSGPRENSIPIDNQLTPSGPGPSRQQSTVLQSPKEARLMQPGGLESFDMNSFNPTNPTSWKMLGDAFQVTNGYSPSQEELMAFVMGGMAMNAGMRKGVGEVPDSTATEETEQPSMGIPQASGKWIEQSYGNQGYSGARGGAGYSAGRGRRGRSNENNRGGGPAWGGFPRDPYSYGSNEDSSDAIVLGAGSAALTGASYGNMHVMQSGVSPVHQTPSPTGADDERRSAGAGGAGGQMKKVGDRWVFVKNSENTPA